MHQANIESAMDDLLDALDKATVAGQPVAGPNNAVTVSSVSFPSVKELGLATARTTPAAAVKGAHVASTSADVSSLDDLMSTYVAAVREIRRMDDGVAEGGRTTSSIPPTPPTSNSLEDTLGSLMRALNANNSDQWIDKPQQESLFDFIEKQRPEWEMQHEQRHAEEVQREEDMTFEVVTLGATSNATASREGVEAVSTEALFVQYLKELKSGNHHPSSTHSAAPHDGQSTAAGQNLSMQELLDALDELT